MGLFFNYEAFALLPGISEISENVVNAVTWGPWEHNRAFVIPTLLAGSSRDYGHDPADLLRPGTLMAGVSDPTDPEYKMMKPWDPDDYDQCLAGVLLYDVKVTGAGSDRNRWFGFVIVSGNVKTSSLILPGTDPEDLTPVGPGDWMDGESGEYYLRNALWFNHFITDDFYYKCYGMWG